MSAVPVPALAAAVAGATVVVLALGGCGGADPDPGATFPLQLRVTGGQSVRDDRATVAADGSVTARVRPAGTTGGEGVEVTCTLSSDVVEDLAEAASDTLRPGATSPVPNGADVEAVLVSGPGGVAYDVDGGDGPLASLTRRVLSDLAREAGRRSLCR